MSHSSIVASCKPDRHWFQWWGNFLNVLSLSILENNKSHDSSQWATTIEGGTHYIDDS